MLHFGKKPAKYDSRDLLYANFRSAAKLPPAPLIFGHGNDFLGEGWKMLGNGPDSTVAKGFEGCGDCVWAGSAHEVMELNYNAQRPIPLFDGNAVVSEYEAYCGYDRRDGSKDEGSDVREVMEWRQKKGIKDRAAKVHKIGPYLALEPKNLEHLYEATWLFECVGIGFEVPESAEQQFSESKPWSVVSGAEVVGGHYVPIRSEERRVGKECRL